MDQNIEAKELGNGINAAPAEEAEVLYANLSVSKEAFNAEFEELKAELEPDLQNDPYYQTIQKNHKELDQEQKELQRELTEKLETARRELRRGPGDTDPMSMLKWSRKIAMLSEKHWGDYREIADLDSSFLTHEDEERLAFAEQWFNVFNDFPQVRNELLEYGGAAKLKNPDEIMAIRGGRSLSSAIGTLDDRYQNASFTNDYRLNNEGLPFTEKDVKNKDWFRADGSRSFTFIVKDEYLKNLNAGELQKQLKDLQKELKATDPFWLWTNTAAFTGLKEKLGSTLKTLDHFRKNQFEGSQAEAKKNLLKELGELADLAQAYSRTKEGNYASSNKSRDLRRGQAAGKILAFASAFVVNEKVNEMAEIAVKSTGKTQLSAEQYVLDTDANKAAKVMVDAVMTAMKYPTVAGCRDTLALAYSRTAANIGPNFARNIGPQINIAFTGNARGNEYHAMEAQKVQEEIRSLKEHAEKLGRNLAAAKEIRNAAHSTDLTAKKGSKSLNGGSV